MGFASFARILMTLLIPVGRMVMLRPTVTPARRLVVALAAFYAARATAIRQLTLDDIDLPCPGGTSDSAATPRSCQSSYTAPSSTGCSIATVSGRTHPVATS